MQSIAAGQDWKAAYEHTAKAVAAKAPKPWNFNVSSVFNFVDAFKERCRYSIVSLSNLTGFSFGVDTCAHHKAFTYLTNALAVASYISVAMQLVSYRQQQPSNLVCNEAVHVNLANSWVIMLC